MIEASTLADASKNFFGYKRRKYSALPTSDFKSYETFLYSEFFYLFRLLLLGFVFLAEYREVNVALRVSLQVLDKRRGTTNGLIEVRIERRVVEQQPHGVVF